MDENIENLDSQNETEGAVDTNEENAANATSEETEGTKPEYTENEKKLYARMKKAEADAKLAREELAKNKPSEKPAPASDIDKILDAKLEKRELEALDLSDQLKKEVQSYATLHNITVKKALESEYIKFQMGQEEKKEKINDASIGGGRKRTIKKDITEFKASDYDLSTPEGRAEYAKAKDEFKKQLG